MSAGVIDISSGNIVDGSVVTVSANCHAPASNLLSEWAVAIDQSIEISGKDVAGVGLAIPGPFDYVHGISHIRGVDKFERMFGVDVAASLPGFMVRHDLPLKFVNDATAFALGEWHAGAARGTGRVICLTLGSGVGSCFIENGQVVTDASRTPENGWVYCLPFEGSTVDEEFSARWFLRRYSEITGRDANGVRELAEIAEHDLAVSPIFEEYGCRLARLIIQLCEHFDCSTVVLGGNISLAYPHFGRSMRSVLSSAAHTVEVRISSLRDSAAMVGAASLFCNGSMPVDKLRKTTQFEAPVIKSENNGDSYDIYPAHDLAPGTIRLDYDSLAEAMARHRHVVVDGYAGVRFDRFKKGLNEALLRRGILALWSDVSAALKPEDEIDHLTEPFLGGDDPLFGTRANITISDFFDTEALSLTRPDPGADMSIVIGTGAALFSWDDALLVYIDLPKNELQFRSRAGGIANLGALAPDDPKKMYKRFYFVDWVVLNRHKKGLVDRVDIFVDDQHSDNIAWCRGDDLRDGLDALARGVFRVRPWFEPGAWGGQWMKERIAGLNHEAENYAWSFELIVPENGLMFQSGGVLFEISFDMLMYRRGRDVVGRECYAAYGDEFPIRMDYLDNFDGGNLSLQCHPHREYIRRNFGEVLTQEESYYITDCVDGAVVYLGFRDNIVPGDFRRALEKSQSCSTPLDFEQYVQTHTSHKHDFFLIPPGTLHSSGRGNLVLEISTTPYIFTFKMYDWLALDLDGKPRPLNIDRGMENLCFDRKGERVAREHISHPSLIDSGPGWERWHLSTHAAHSYDVHRLHIVPGASVTEQTCDRCHVLNLVSGEGLMIESASGMGMRRLLHYAETCVVPAAAGSYRIVNLSGSAAMVVKAFMKPATGNG